MIPGADIVLGLFVQVLVWLALWTIRAAIRAVKACLFGHPGVTLLAVVACRELGWLAGFGPTLVDWTPVVELLLLLTFAAQFFGEHPPADVRRELAKQIREMRHMTEAVAAGAAGAAAWAARHTVAPPPPVAPPGHVLHPGATPTGPATEPAPPPARADVIDVQEAPEPIPVGPVTEVSA